MLSFVMEYMGDFDTHEWVTFITFHNGIDGNLYANLGMLFLIMPNVDMFLET